MTLIKIVLLLIVALAFITIALANKYKTFNKVLIIFFFSVAAYFILFPQSSDNIAQLFGIEKGANLALYLSVSILFLFVGSLYAKVKRQDRTITKIIRKRALDTYVKND
jgi:hypothetical protein